MARYGIGDVLESKRMCGLKTLIIRKGPMATIRCANKTLIAKEEEGGFWFSCTFSFSFFHLTYSRWTSSLPSCLWSQRIFPSLPRFTPYIFLSRCKFSTLTTRQPMVEFYLLTFPRFPLRKKEHKSYFGKNRTHDFRTSRCAAYLLDHSGD